MSGTKRHDEAKARRLKREIQAVARSNPAHIPSEAKPPLKVWIIYAHREDEPIARDLVVRLRSDDVSATWDKDLLPGVDYDSFIEQSIRDCDSAVVIWSSQATESSYLFDEATLALDLDKLVPVHVDGFDPATLSMRFRRRQATSIVDYEKLLRRLRGAG